MKKSTRQADDSSHDNQYAEFPLLDLDQNIREENIYPNFSVKECGLFAETARAAEEGVALLRLLTSAVNAEPETYKRKEDKTKQHDDKYTLAAIAILKRHPKLLFKQDTVTDHFGRKIFASPYQLFLGAGDVWALKQVHDAIIPNIKDVDGEAQAQAQFKAQFPHCQQGFDPKKGEEQLYDDRNITQVEQVIEQLKIITASITADPCTNGIATWRETTKAVKELCQIFMPKEGEIIRTGLHFPLAIMHEIFKIYDDQFDAWRGSQLSFYSREVIGAVESALTTVDGQWCKHGFRKLDMTKGPDRGDGLFCRHPRGIPAELAPISIKLGDKMFVDPYDGLSWILSSTAGAFYCTNKNGRFRGEASFTWWARAAFGYHGYFFEKLWRTKSETYEQYYAATLRCMNTLSTRP